MPIVEILFDRDCGFCAKCVGFLQRIDRHDRVRIVGAQDAGGPEHFGIDLNQALEQVWALDADGVRHGGAAAVNVALGAVLGTRIPLWVYRIPGIRQIQDRVYSWVAANRYRLPGKGGTCAIERPA